jgi:hypothetical protein
VVAFALSVSGKDEVYELRPPRRVRPLDTRYTVQRVMIVPDAIAKVVPIRYASRREDAE